MKKNEIPVATTVPFEPFGVGLCSGFNFGGPDFRQGLLEVAWQKFRKEKPLYIVLLGGLVDSKAMMAALKGYLIDVNSKDKMRAQRTFLSGHAKALSRAIPRIKGINLYIVTSPAYDGWIGEEMARRLYMLRPGDIRIYRSGSDKLQLRQIEALLGAYTPERQSWRGDYFDTPGLRILKDLKKRSTRGLGDVNVVGCLGSSVFNPGDSTDVKAPYFLIPVLHKLSETRTSENQEGIALLKFTTPNPQEVTASTINFKDLLLDERQYIRAPRGSSDVQRKIVEVLKVKDSPPNSIREELKKMGVEDADVSYEATIENLKWLSRQHATETWPRIFLDKAANRWSFHHEWFTSTLRYTLPDTEKVEEDMILGVGCVHAGCKRTDMEFIRSGMPGIILSGGINNVCGAGDFIEGMKHDLMLKGGVYGGRKYVYNYTIQEKLAGWLFAYAFFKVFATRFAKYLDKDFNKRSREERIAAFKEALVSFYYIPGNHCDWVMSAGFYPLVTFRSELKSFLTYKILELLEKNGINADGLSVAVKSKIFRLNRGQEVKLDSGLSFVLLHPSMSRTKTPSIRAQEMLAFAEGKKCQIVLGANFHTAEVVNEWVPEIGQRVCLVIPTLKSGSEFEDDKLKIVDTGVGVLSVTSRNGRIFQADGNFRYIPTENMEEANKKILDEFEAWLDLEE